jgi:hypothetical protein
MLEGFDGESEMAIEASFPGIDAWGVKTYNFSIGTDDDGNGPKLGVSIYGSNFDCPEVLRVL